MIVSFTSVFWGVFLFFVEGGSAFVCNSEIACVQNMLQLANKSGHQSLSKFLHGEG